MNCLLRKFILKQVNKLLDDYKENIGKAKESVWLWLKRADVINKYLQGLYEKLSDDQLTEDEWKSALDEFKQIIEKWRG